MSRNDIERAIKDVRGLIEARKNMRFIDAYIDDQLLNLIEILFKTLEKNET